MICHLIYITLECKLIANKIQDCFHRSSILFSPLHLGVNKLAPSHCVNVFANHSKITNPAAHLQQITEP